MSPTRRQTLLFAAATLAGAALPHGSAPAALAAENTGVDVLDVDEAEQYLSGRQRWFLVGFKEWERGIASAAVYVEPAPEGGARLIFQPTRGDHRPERFTADPGVEQIIVPIDAATFRRLHHAAWSYAD